MRGRVDGWPGLPVAGPAGVLYPAQHVDGEGVAFGAGAQPGGHLQQRGEGLVHGVARVSLRSARSSSSRVCAVVCSACSTRRVASSAAGPA